MSDEDAGMHRGGDLPAEPGCASLPEDLLREILVRLPPDPSSLPRASAVCKRWRRVVTDPKFLCLFRAHHRKPPLLGVFELLGDKIVFSPMLDPPDRIRRERFSLGRCGRHGGVLDVRHGHVLVIEAKCTQQLSVCDPITRQRRRVSIPPEINDMGFLNGAVLCAAGDQGHVHGACHSSPFKVVLVYMCGPDNRSVACVYSSDTGIWCDLISTDAPYELRADAAKQSALVGNALYWLSVSDGILELDLDEHSLTVIEGPPTTKYFHIQNRKVIRAEDGAVGFAMFSYSHLQMWKRNVNGHGGVATWEPWKAIEMHSILGFCPQFEGMLGWLLAYDEDADVMFLYAFGSVYMVQLKSTQSKWLSEFHYTNNRYFFPFSSFYTPGEGMAAVVLSPTLSHCINVAGSVFYMVTEEKTHRVIA